MPQINNAGLSLIKNFEGCRLQAYQDAVGVWTIGFGHTGGVYAGQTITQDQADALLEQDLHYFEVGVNSRVARNATPNQFAAMVSLAYNIGIYAFGGSSVLRNFNAGEINAAADSFLLWNKADGDVLEGLVRRRTAERALFLTP